MLLVEQLSPIYFTGCVLTSDGCGYFYVATLNPHRKMSSGIGFNPFRPTRASGMFAATLFRETTIGMFPEEVHTGIAAGLMRLFANKNLPAGNQADTTALAEELEALQPRSGILSAQEVPELLTATKTPDAQDAIDRIALRVLASTRPPSYN